MLWLPGGGVVGAPWDEERVLGYRLPTGLPGCRSEVSMRVIGSLDSVDSAACCSWLERVTLTWRAGQSMLRPF